MAYTKNTWNTGDIVSSQKLNHMEDGIANSENVFIVGGASFGENNALEGTLDKTWQEIHDALQTKVVIASIVNGSDIRQVTASEAVYDQTENKFVIVLHDTGFITDTENGYPTAGEGPK